jgi:CheY-like chemotaxis protein
MSERLRPILAAEDEESDRMILEVAFRRAKLSRPLVIVRDGEEAVDYLSGKGHFGDRSAHPLPALVVLDLKMPRMSGFDVLSWLARQPELREIPAVVLSSSADESDMGKAWQLGAREYFVKPHSLDELIKIAHQLQARCLTAAAPDASIHRVNSMNRIQCRAGLISNPG